MKLIEYNQHGNAIPPIALKPDEDVNATDHEKTSFEWKDSAGNRVKKDVVVFGKGSVELLIKWREAMEQLLNDQKVVDLQDRINAFNRVLKNPAKNIYNNGIHQHRMLADAKVAEARRADPTVAADYTESHVMGMNALGQVTFPSEAYTIQRNWLQLHVRKPLEVTVRNFQFRIEEINTMLIQFPGDRGQRAVSLNEIELKELFWRAIPRKWQVRLTDKSVKRHLISKSEFIDELDTIQLVELQQNALERKGPKAATQSSNGYKGSQSNAGGKRKSDKNNDNNNNKKFKKLHGTAPDGEQKNSAYAMDGTTPM